MKGNQINDLLSNKNFDQCQKVDLVIAYLNFLHNHQTRRTESEYHIVLAYSTIVAGTFVLITVIGKAGLNLSPWVRIVLTTFLSILGVINILKICYSHKIYAELGTEIRRVEKELGFNDKDIFLKYEPLCKLSGTLGKGCGYLFNVFVIFLAASLAIFVIWVL